MSIFAKAKQQAREANKPKTRVIQVQEYVRHEDVNKWQIKGVDLFEKDDKGVPKEVMVSVNNAKGNVRGVKDFANKSSLNATHPGGVIRVDRGVERGNGQIVAQHLKRLSIDESMTREDENGAVNKIGIGENWVKVVPVSENGQLKEFPTANNGLVHRGNAYIIPKDQTEVKMVVGQDDVKAKLKEAAENAINEAPEKTLAMVRLRSPGDNNHLEVVMPNSTPDSNGNYQPTSTEDKLEAFFNNTGVRSLMDNLNDAQGLEMYAGAGYRATVFSTAVDFESGARLETTDVQRMANDTTRRIVRPNPEAKPDERNYTVVSQNPEYVLAVTSLEIPHTDHMGRPSERPFATLKSIGRQPGVTASPVGHPDHVTPNPYAAEWQAFRNAGQAQTQGASAPQSPEQASYQAQAPDNRGNAATAAAAGATAAAATTTANEPAPAESAETATTAVDPDMAAQADAQADMALDDLDDGLDFDELSADDLEQELGM